MFNFLLSGGSFSCCSWHYVSQFVPGHLPVESFTMREPYVVLVALLHVVSREPLFDLDALGELHVVPVILGASGFYAGFEKMEGQFAGITAGFEELVWVRRLCLHSAYS